jgi:2-keto-4-pentenoate hydratase
MINKTILKRLRTQIGYPEVMDVTDLDVELATVLTLLGEREAMGRVAALCDKHPAASARWIAKVLFDNWENAEDLDDGKEAPRIVTLGGVR